MPIPMAMHRLKPTIASGSFFANVSWENLENIRQSHLRSGIKRVDGRILKILIKKTVPAPISA